MKVLHSSMEITDQFYSNLNDKEIQDRISHLGNGPEQNGVSVENIDALIGVLQSLRNKGVNREVRGKQLLVYTPRGGYSYIFGLVFTQGLPMSFSS